MALNSSGPISLGGSTTGQSINLENGLSATAQVSLNDAAVRNLAGLPTVNTTIIMPTNFYGKSNITYFLGLITSAQLITLFYDGKLDSSGNIYSVGTYGANNLNDTFVVKFNNSGAIQFQVTGTTSGSFTDRWGFVAVAPSSGNTYVIGDVRGFSDPFWGIAKYNSSGTLQWSRSIQTTSAAFDDSGNIVIDSSENVYVIGDLNNFANITLAKYDTNGTIQWQRIVGTSSKFFGRVAIDSSGNLYAGFCALSGSFYQAQFMKLNSTATAVTWQKAISNASVDVYIQYIYIDSSSNVYVLGQVRNTSAFIFKFDSSGNTLWQRTLSSGIANADGYTGMVLDSSSNIYVIGTMSTSASTNLSVLVKYDTNGTLQWQRSYKRTTTSGSDTFGGIAIDSNGTLYISGSTTTTTTAPVGYSGLLLKLPSDGSKTGVYTVGGVSFTYAVSTFTSATGSLTVSTPGNSTSAGSGTEGALSLTTGTASATSNTTTI